MIPSHAEGDATPPDAPVRKTLPNGLRIICLQQKETPLVAIDVFVKAGQGQETAETAGLGSFVAQTLLSSTSNRPGTMQFQINALGGNVSVTRQPDWMLVSALTVADKFDDATDLVSDVVQNADFEDDDAIEAARHEILGEIDSENAGILSTAYANVRRALYPTGDEALPSLGTARSIKRITKTSLLAYFHRFFVPKNLVVVVVGDVDSKLAISVLQKEFEDFPTAGRNTHRYSVPAAPDIAPLTRTPPPVNALMPGISELCVVAGYRAPSQSSEDYPAVLVLNALLGGMKSSRLFTSLREKQSLSYELGSFYTPRLNSADLAAYAFSSAVSGDSTVAKQKAQTSVIQEELLRQVESFKTTAPADAELTRAKHFVIGSYKIKHERLEDRAKLLGTAEIAAKDGMKLDTNFADYINAVTAADIVRVAKRYLVHPAVSTIEPAPDASTDTSQ